MASLWVNGHSVHKGTLHSIQLVPNVWAWTQVRVVRRLKRNRSQKESTFIREFGGERLQSPLVTADVKVRGNQLHLQCLSYVLLVSVKDFPLYPVFLG